MSIFFVVFCGNTWKCDVRKDVFDHTSYITCVLFWHALRKRAGHQWRSQTFCDGRAHYSEKIL